jgi:hypothetical protein
MFALLVAIKESRSSLKHAVAAADGLWLVTGAAVG